MVKGELLRGFIAKPRDTLPNVDLLIDSINNLTQHRREVIKCFGLRLIAIRNNSSNLNNDDKWQQFTEAWLISDNVSFLWIAAGVHKADGLIAFFDDLLETFQAILLTRPNSDEKIWLVNKLNEPCHSWLRQQSVLVDFDKIEELKLLKKDETSTDGISLTEITTSRVPIELLSNENCPTPELKTLNKDDKFFKFMDELERKIGRSLQRCEIHILHSREQRCRVYRINDAYRGFSVVKLVDLKIYDEKYVAGSGCSARLRREIEMLSREDVARNANIVKLLRPCFVGLGESLMFLELEYCNGPNLLQLVKHFKLQSWAFDEDLILKPWHRQMSSALAWIHSLDIVHRDVKSSNFFTALQLDGKLNVKLGDFGMAKHRFQSVPTTPTGMPLGTPGYTHSFLRLPDPETDRDDPRGDVWSYGVVLFELAALDKPYGGREVDPVSFAEYVRDKKRTVKIDTAIYSTNFVEFIEKLLQPNLLHSPSSAVEITTGWWLGDDDRK